MSYRTDLASELEQRISLENNHIEGIEKSEFSTKKTKVTRICVTSPHASQILGKPEGEYVTMSAVNDFDNSVENVFQVAEILCEELKKICPNFTSVLVVGLGNDQITPDNIGPIVAKNVFATRHIRLFAPELFDENSTEVSVIAPSVTAKTGYEAAEIVKALCEKNTPDLVIVVDALACGEISNLCRTIQITNTGISPGSGVNNARTELSENTLGAPTVAIGVPTVIDLQTAVFQLSDAQDYDKDFSQMMVTPRNIDKLVKTTAKIIYTGLNLLLHPDLAPDEISTLVE